MSRVPWESLSDDPAVEVAELRQEVFDLKMRLAQSVLITELDAAETELLRLRAAVALHHSERTLLGVERCAECTADWPCPTVRASYPPT